MIEVTVKALPSLEVLRDSYGSAQVLKRKSIVQGCVQQHANHRVVHESDLLDSQDLAYILAFCLKSETVLSLILNVHDASVKTSDRNKYQAEYREDLSSSIGCDNQRQDAQHCDCKVHASLGTVKPCAAKLVTFHR